MKRLLKITSYTVAMAFFTVALSGCTLNTAKTVNPRTNKVIVWSFESPYVWKNIISQFKTDNPGMTIEYDQQNLDSSYENRVLNSELSGTGPDVWAMPNDWVYRHKDKLVAMPTTSQADVLGNTFVQSIKQSVQIGGKVYALAPSSEPLMIYYNPALVTKEVNDYESTLTDQAAITSINNMFSPIPKTWTDFASAMKILTKKSGSTINVAGAALGTDGVSNSQDILYLLMLQNQTQILSQDLQLATFSLPSSTSADATNIPGQKALDFYTSFANPTSPNYAWSDSLGNDVDAFVNGKVAMIFGYSRLQDTLAQKYPEFKGFNKAYVPQLNTQPDKIVDYATFYAFGVSNVAPNSTAAWKLVQSLATTYSGDYDSASRVASSALNGSNPTISMDLRGDNNPENYELLTAKSFMKGRYPEDFDANIRNAIRSVNKGMLDSKSALNLAADSITQLLRKTTW